MKEQADRGEKLYEDHCVKCHEGNDPEGPILMGRSFVERWREDSLDSLYSFMSERMPRDAPGKLEDAEYLDLLTFLLRANSYPDGAQPLTADSLARVLLVGPDGPKPLPPNTLIRSVGCLTQVSADQWTLTQATTPERSRQGKETSPEELKTSASRALGTQTFALSNFTNIEVAFKPDPFKGHKVQVKGVLIRQSGSERISLTLLDTLAPACE